MKKIIAVVMAFAFVLSLASCTTNKDRYKNLSGAVDYVGKKLDMVAELIESNGSQDVGNFEPSDDGEFIDDGDSSDAEEPGDSGDNGDSSSSSSSNSSSSSSKSSSSKSSSSSSSNSKSSSSSKQQTGNSTSDIVAKYVSAAKATDKNVKVTVTKTLVKLNGGDAGLGGLISALEGAAKNILADKSGTETGVRGNLDLITVNDFSKVTSSNDGSFTTVNMTIKDYTATADGRSNEGSVGHVIGVLDTIKEATDPMGMEAVGDTSNIRLKYSNAKVTAKINNKTNKIVSAKWEYDVDVVIPDNKVKFKGVTLTLRNANVVIHYQAVL